MNIEKKQYVDVVTFNNSKMICPMIDDRPYVLVKSIIDGIGLDYK